MGYLRVDVLELGEDLRVDHVELGLDLEAPDVVDRLDLFVQYQMLCGAGEPADRAQGPGLFRSWTP